MLPFLVYSDIAQVGEIFPFEDKNLHYGECLGCWCLDLFQSQGIISHGVDLALPEIPTSAPGG